MIKLSAPFYSYLILCHMHHAGVGVVSRAYYFGKKLLPMSMHSSTGTHLVHCWTPSFRGLKTTGEHDRGLAGYQNELDLWTKPVFADPNGKWERVHREMRDRYYLRKSITMEYPRDFTSHGVIIS